MHAARVRPQNGGSSDNPREPEPDEWLGLFLMWRPVISDVRRIPWLRILIEGVVIVVSILLAFGIDAAWQARTDRALERDLISALERDMEQNLREADRVLLGNETRTAHLRTVLESPVPELEAIPADSTRSMLLHLAFVSTFTPYDGSVRTADLSVLRDPGLREAIGTWAGVVANATETTALLFTYARELRPTFGEAILREMSGMTTGDSTFHSLVALRADEDFVEAALAMEMTVLSYTSLKMNRVRDATEVVLRRLRE